jgi:hypothetical protein
MIVGTRSPVAGFPDPELGPGVVPHYCRAAAETEANIGRVIGIRHVFHRRKPGPPSREGEIGLQDAYCVTGTRRVAGCVLCHRNSSPELAR